MGVDLETYRGRVGTFKFSSGVDVCTLQILINFSKGMKVIGSVVFFVTLLLMAGIESNPGPRTQDNSGDDEGTYKHTGMARPIIPKNNGPGELSTLQAPVVLQCDDSNNRSFMSVSAQAEQSMCTSYTPFKVNQRGINASTNDRLSGLLSELGLTDRFPDKITFNDVTAFTTTELNNGTLTNIPWILLSKIISTQSDARDTILPDIFCGFHEPSVSGSAEDEDDNDSSADEEENYSPLDIFAIVFQCCDPRLKQLVVTKCYLCKLAVPFLYKTNTKSKVFIWPLRTLKIDYFDPDEALYREGHVLTMETNVVTFSRIGRPQCSKSQLLNALLTDKPNLYSTFFNHECQLGQSDKHISKGSVEIFWLPQVGENKGLLKVVAHTITFLNMRGNLVEDLNPDCVDFVSSISDCMVIVLKAEYLPKLMKMCDAILKHVPSVILVVSSPLTKDDKASLSKLKKLFESSNKVLAFFSTYKRDNKLNCLQISRWLSEIIIQFKNNFQSKSLQTRIAKATCTTKEGIELDENDRDCVEAKSDADIIFRIMEDDMKKWNSALNITNETKWHWKDALTPASFKGSRELGKLIKGMYEKGSSKKKTPWNGQYER